MKFNKKVYRDRRNKGFRGQISVPGTPQYTYEQRRVDKLAHKLKLDKLRKEVDQKEIKETS